MRFLFEHISKVVLTLNVFLIETTQLLLNVNCIICPLSMYLYFSTYWDYIIQFNKLLKITAICAVLAVLSRLFLHNYYYNIPRYAIKVFYVTEQFTQKCDNHFRYPRLPKPLWYYVQPQFLSQISNISDVSWLVCYSKLLLPD